MSAVNFATMIMENNKAIKFEKQDWQLAIVLLVALSLALAAHLVTLETLHELETSGTNMMGVYDGAESLRSLDRHLIELVHVQNNFLESEEDQLVQKAEEAIQGIEKDLASIKRFFQNSLTSPSLMKLEGLVQQKIAFHRKIINTSRQEGKIVAAQVLDLDWGSNLRDRILQVTDSLRHHHRQHMLNYLDRKSGLAAKLQLISLVSVAFVFLLAVFSIFYLMRTAKRRHELLNNLVEAKEKAEHAAFLKEQFIANMSHEIRTPLNAIIGFSNLLNRTPLQDNQPEFVQSIRTSSENLLSIINDILDFSKIEAGALRLEKIPFNLYGLVHSVENMFRYREKVNQLAFRVQIDEKVSKHLLGDPTRLTQILVNLLGNAFKFTEAGEVSLFVTIRQKKAHMAVVRFEIQDTGIGIPAEKLGNIFERFAQGSSDTTRRYGGAGLGLTITKQLVEIQNGTIKVDSEADIGTTFFVEIPYQFAPDLENGLKSNEPSKIGLEPEEFCILLVEDNPMNRRVAELLLDEWDFCHEHAANGRIAMKMLTEKVYDLVLMDIQMPEMDGYTTSQKIRQELGLQVPIVATTAHAFAGEREKCLSYGMNDYIAKPLHEEELMQLITRFVKPGKKSTASPNKYKPAKATTVNKAVLDFNEAYVLDIAKGDRETIKEMGTIFLSQSEKEIREIEKALSAKNFGLVASAAHSMKSTVSYMGFASSLGSALQKLELETSKEQPSAALLWKQFKQVKRDINTAIHFIQQEFLT